MPQSAHCLKRPKRVQRSKHVKRWRAPFQALTNCHTIEDPPMRQQLNNFAHCTRVSVARARASKIARCACCDCIECFGRFRSG
eukprot:10573641-Lingulodinium_polyedra.AAC.1